MFWPLSKTYTPSGTAAMETALPLVVRRALLGLPVERPLELRLEPQRYPHREALPVLHIFALVVLAVPNNALLLRILLERLRCVRPQNAARQVPDDLPVSVLDGHRHIAEALRLKGDGHAVACPHDLRLLREVEHRFPFHLEFVQVRGRGHNEGAQ